MLLAKDLVERIHIPNYASINGNLHSPHNASVLRFLGYPEDKYAQSQITTGNVGPFELTGNVRFLALLTAVLGAIKIEKPEHYKFLKTAGCYSLRAQRGTTSIFSNHSWGIAVDLFYGGSVVPRGSVLTNRGLIDLYPFFHNAGLYWGAEYPVPDAMHWEASTELLTKWYGNNTPHPHA